jgi:hypothetical protein
MQEWVEYAISQLDAPFLRMTPTPCAIVAKQHRTVFHKEFPIGSNNEMMMRAMMMNTLVL